MDQETWPPPPEGQEPTAPTHYLGGGIDVWIESGVLTLQFAWPRSDALIRSCFAVAGWTTFAISAYRRDGWHGHFSWFWAAVVNCVIVLAFVWRNYMQTQSRGLYRFTPDGTVVTGALTPKRYARVQNVNLLYSRFWGRMFVTLDEEDSTTTDSNQVLLSYFSNRPAAERVAQIIGEFLKVPVIVE